MPYRIAGIDVHKRMNPDLPEELQRIVNKALEKDRKLRCQTASELRADLQRLKRESDSGSKSAAGTAVAQTKPASRRWIYAVLAAVLIAAIGVGAYLFFARAEPIDSIAVLPFENVGGDPSMEYLSDGITDELINKLTQLQNLSVRPRSLVFQYKGKKNDPQKVAKDLNVRAILMGRIDGASVKPELVDVAKVKQLWGDIYDRKSITDLAIQEDIIKKVAENLRLRLTDDEQRTLSRRNTANNEANQLYLKGRLAWNRRTEEGLNRGIEFFQKAIDEDPGFALAYVGLADCYAVLCSLSYLAPKEAFPKAKAAAERALKLDENLAEAHASLAYAATVYDWNWQEAEKEFKRAIALNPNYATAHYWYGYFLGAIGRFDEGVLEYSRALELEPLSLIINSNLGRHYILSRQYEQAAKQLIKTLEIDPNFAHAHCMLGLCYFEQLALGSAVSESERAVALEPNSPIYISLLGRAYARAGQRNNASRMLNDLQKLSKSRYVSPMSIARILYQMDGNKENYLAELEKAYEARDENLYTLKAPWHDPLRSHPRFKALLSKMNFPEK